MREKRSFKKQQLINIYYKSYFGNVVMAEVFGVQALDPWPVDGGCNGRRDDIVAVALGGHGQPIPDVRVPPGLLACLHMNKPVLHRN